MRRLTIKVRAAAGFRREFEGIGREVEDAFTGWTDQESATHSLMATWIWFGFMSLPVATDGPISHPYPMVYSTCKSRYFSSHGVARFRTRLASGSTSNSNRFALSLVASEEAGSLRISIRMGTDSAVR